MQDSNDPIEQIGTNEDPSIFLGLPALTRAIAELRWLGGYSYGEIATMVKLPPSEVYQHIREARRKIEKDQEA